MQRYTDWSVDYAPPSAAVGTSHPSNVHFEMWYTDLKKKLRQERNPSTVAAEDPRYASGPWGIQAAVNAPLAQSPSQGGGRGVMPSNCPPPMMSGSTSTSAQHAAAPRLMEGDRLAGGPWGGEGGAAAQTSDVPVMPSSAVAPRRRGPSAAPSQFAPQEVQRQQQYWQVPVEPPVVATYATHEMPPPTNPNCIVPLGTPQLPYELTLPTPQARARLEAFLQQGNGGEGHGGAWAGGGDRPPVLMATRPVPVYGGGSGADTRPGHHQAIPSNSALPFGVQGRRRRQREMALDDTAYALALDRQYMVAREGARLTSAAGAPIAQSTRSARARAEKAPAQAPRGFTTTADGRPFATLTAAERGKVVAELAQRRDTLLQQEGLIRSGIADAEQRFRAFIVTNTKAPVGPSAPEKRAAAHRQQYDAAVAILSHFRDGLGRIESEEGLRRRCIEEGFAAWQDLIKARHDAELSAITQQYARAHAHLAAQGLLVGVGPTASASARLAPSYGGPQGSGGPAMIGLGPFAAQRVGSDELAGRESISRAEGASRGLLEVRSAALREACAAYWQQALGVGSRDEADALLAQRATARQRGPSVANSHGASPLYGPARADPNAQTASAFALAVRGRYTKELAASLSALSESEGAARTVLARAENGYRQAIVAAFTARTSVAMERHRALAAVLRERADGTSARGLLEEAEATGRAGIANAAEGWRRGMVVQFTATVTQYAAYWAEQMRLVQAALDSLPKLSDIEEDEAARRRYLVRTYDEWCQQTLAPTGARLAEGVAVQHRVTHQIRSAVATAMCALLQDEEQLRETIVASQEDWWRHMLELEFLGRIRGVPEAARQAAVERVTSQSFLLVQEHHKALGVVEDDETAKRSALEAAEAQWARFCYGALHPNGQPPTVAAVRIMQERDAAAAAHREAVDSANTSALTLRPRPSSSATHTEKERQQQQAARQQVPWDAATSFPHSERGGATAVRRQSLPLAPISNAAANSGRLRAPSAVSAAKKPSGAIPRPLSSGAFTALPGVAIHKSTSNRGQSSSSSPTYHSSGASPSPTRYDYVSAGPSPLYGAMPLSHNNSFANAFNANRPSSGGSMVSKVAAFVTPSVGMPPRPSPNIYTPL